jgi:hypothetical protein
MAAPAKSTPFVHEVHSCGDCPLCNVYSDHDNYEPPWCGHPLAVEIATEPEGLPSRCPLRKTDLLVRIGGSHG